MDHELYTQMLFTDAIIGLGFPTHMIEVSAHRNGLAADSAWDRTALESLPVPTLQDLYTSLKLNKVTQ